jgi:hypothetical protein
MGLILIEVFEVSVDEQIVMYPRDFGSRVDGLSRTFYSA